MTQGVENMSSLPPWWQQQGRMDLPIYSVARTNRVKDMAIHLCYFNYSCL